MLAEDGWRGAERAYAWSFYSQGTGRITDSDTFFNEALAWFGATTDEWQGRSIWDRADLLAERRQRTLLILDGVEPPQSGDQGVDRAACAIRASARSSRYSPRGTQACAL